MPLNHASVSFHEFREDSKFDIFFDIISDAGKDLRVRIPMCSLVAPKIATKGQCVKKQTYTEHLEEAFSYISCGQTSPGCQWACHLQSWAVCVPAWEAYCWYIFALTAVAKGHMVRTCKCSNGTPCNSNKAIVLNQSSIAGATSIAIMNRTMHTIITPTTSSTAVYDQWLSHYCIESWLALLFISLLWSLYSFFESRCVISMMRQKIFAAQGGSGNLDLAEMHKS